uniref:BRCA1-associated protein n=1 Tax=Tetradesmus obliquus TaxID=3088 RepID=A0A383VK63_TETOB|eukprot:jgi/Sobl393_1/14577/SZX65928.1
MFHIVIEPIKRQMSELLPSEDDNDYTEVFRESLDTECVEFSVGNPRVEHITGIVHLYKRNSTPYGSAAVAQAASTTPQSSAQAAAADSFDGSTTVCCLAIPADMSVAHFCSFIGAYLSEVRAIQVLRREGVQPSVCMVLLSFAGQQQADSFHADFHGQPFSSLEPDILCRLVFVRSVEVLSARGRPTLTLPAAANNAANTAASSTAAATSSAAATAAGASAAAAGSSAASAKVAAAAGAADAGGKAGNGSSSSKASQSPKHSERDKPAEVKAAAAATDAAAAEANSSSSVSENAATSSSSSTAAGKGSSGEISAAPEAPAAPGTDWQTYASVASGGAAALSPPSGPVAPAAAAAAGGSGAAVAVASSAAPCVLWLEAPQGTTELPTCPVCLERLDEHISGIVTTVCNHRFHGECLKRWGDTSCPVCRYCMYSASTSTSRCSTCGTNANLWICLICGHVGCGRYKQGHASDHWKQSAHCYALELETQRVWDYAGDGYVHRLIQSKTDGKLVEVPSPAPACSHSSPGHHSHHQQQHSRHRHSSAARALDRAGSGCSGAAAGSGSGGGAEQGSGCGSSSCPVCVDEQAQMKEALVSSKLDAITLEYNYLLTTQLDSQRQYFEGLLSQQEAAARQQLASVQQKAEAEAAQRAAALATAKEAERRRQQMERKLSELSSAAAKAAEEREFLRSLNETLLANQKEFGAKLTAAQAAAADKDAQLQDLQEQVRDLMVFIEAQKTIQSAGGELQDATLLPMPAKEASSSSWRRRSSRK